MEAVIDPSGPTCVSFVQEGTVLLNDFANFVKVPVSLELVGKPLKAALVNDTWVLSLNEDAILTQAWTDLRAERNRRLQASDWVALADANLSQDRKDRWFAYRQELRDLPESVTDPVQVEWPVVPDASSRLGAPIEHTDVVEIQEPVSVPQVT